MSADMEKIVSAIIYTILLVLVNAGFMWAAYISIVFYLFQVILLLLASSVIIHNQYRKDTVILDLASKNRGRKRFENPIFNLLLHSLSAVVIMSLYNAGFIFIAGLASFLVLYGMSANIYILVMGLPE